MVMAMLYDMFFSIQYIKIVTSYVTNFPKEIKIKINLNFILFVFKDIDTNIFKKIVFLTKMAFTPQFLIET